MRENKQENFDPSLNILHRSQKKLDAIFHPKTIALIGATETANSVGRTLLWNLLRSPFGGTVYPVNPKRSSVLGIKAYPSVADVPDEIDLAVIVTPAKAVPQIISQCVDAGVKSSVIISAGFKEVGEKGIEMEQKILEIAKKGNMRIIGPNCLGVMNPVTGLNATFAADIALKGNIAFISQSGALCTAVLDWSFDANVGFSGFVSIGSMLDVSWGDLITYFGQDPNTKSILIYMESVGDTRAFLSAAREVALTKPIILIKAGRTEESAKAAASHTGSLAGSDDVLNAALKRVGVLRVDTISDLFSMAEVLSKQQLPRGPNLAVITNAGGPGVIATDALILEGGKLAKISENTFAELNKILPEQWSHNNPIDVLGDASAELYAKAIEIVSKDPHSDGILVILTPQDMTDPTKTAEEITRYAHIENKPLLASWMGSKHVKKGSEILNQAGIPTFAYPDTACKAFAYMWKYSESLRGIYEIPTLFEDFEDESLVLQRKKEIDRIFEKVREEKREILDEFESKKVLELYQIPVVPTYVAVTKEEAVEYAEKIGFPVVLKLFSKTITHKTDVGGVKLRLRNKDTVKLAYEEIYESVKKKVGKEHFQGVTVQPMIELSGTEIILGSSIDPEFGPVILFGRGGQLVEVFKDRALALPPLNSTLAKRMMEQTQVLEVLKGVRGQKGCDLVELEKILVRFSDLIAEHPEIKEFDINPLLASDKQIIALDARIVLHEADLADDELPELAIRPYPLKYVESWVLKDHTPVVIRPIRPEDEPLVVKFHKDLSEHTVRQRFLKMVHYDERVARDRLVRICFNDYDREIALVVEMTVGDYKEILGICRLSKVPGSENAVFTVTIKDKWQNKGIGTKLLEKICLIAKDEKVKTIFAELLSENIEMQKLLKKHQFSITESKQTGILIAKINLDEI